MSENNHWDRRDGSPAPLKRVVVVHSPAEDSIPVYSLVVNGDSSVLSLSKTEPEDSGEDQRLTVAVRMPVEKPVVVVNGEDAEALAAFAARVGELAGLKGHMPGY